MRCSNPTHRWGRSSVPATWFPAQPAVLQQQQLEQKVTFYRRWVGTLTIIFFLFLLHVLFFFFFAILKEVSHHRSHHWPVLVSLVPTTNEWGKFSHLCRSSAAAWASHKLNQICLMEKHHTKSASSGGNGIHNIPAVNWQWLSTTPSHGPPC